MNSVAVGMGKIFKRAVGGHVLYIPAGVSKSASMGRLLASPYVKVELGADGKMLVSPTNEDLVLNREGDAIKTTPNASDARIQAPVAGVFVASTINNTETLSIQL